MTMDGANLGPTLLPYEDAKARARHQDARVRQDLARRRDAQPEILYFLAADKDPKVRRAIAGNTSAPVQSGLILAQDTDERVRQALAEKVAHLAPDFDPTSRARAERHVIETLELLAKDQAKRVRHILAEVLGDQTNAPASVIHDLAEDIEDEVACLVLEASPLLTDEDLLSIIERVRQGPRLTAVSRRPGLSEQISDAIVASADRIAITALLSNTSAQIRETTLDDLVRDAVEVPEWHAPLVDRPELSRESVERLAGFVAKTLLSKLAHHPALDADSASRVAAEIEKRMQSQGDDEAPDESPDPDDAKRLHETGRLDLEALCEALTAGKTDFVIDGIALLSGRPRGFVEKILQSSSAKGITAIAWQAGLTMHLATQVQFQLGAVMPKKALYAREDGGYPLSEEEMRWQLQFFESLMQQSSKRQAAR
jgi:uncharacterized protein (DUF2336 family)